MSATATRRTRETVAKRSGIILHLGCRAEKQPGAVGMDPLPGPNVDIVWDWNRIPWPVESGSVLTLLAGGLGANVVERVPRLDASFGLHFISWMNECWRVVQPERQLVIVVSWAGSEALHADPGAVHGCNHQTWQYFDPAITGKQSDGREWTPYRIYEPAPWEITDMAYPLHKPMQVVLRKRRDIADYHADGKIHYR